ncbi:DUF6115 domain-containing protein [Sulfurospirillum sp. 1612]|uniref:DUF6115 domain-containing protein n=1 Tax=Sulfurospirillum sp. 1612 TaxID=3094835 RepID=UPI002F91DA67
MNIEFAGLIALGILVAVLFFIMMLRDQEVAKKLSIYEKIIEDLNHEHHQLSKEIQNLSKSNDFDLEAFRTEVAQQVAFEVQNSLTPIIQSIKEIDEIMQTFQDEQTNRIDALEHRTKEKNFSQINNTESNEKTIISQYKSGKSEAMIAKDLRIGIGEVDLILKLANLK